MFVYSLFQLENSIKSSKQQCYWLLFNYMHLEHDVVMIRRHEELRCEQRQVVMNRSVVASWLTNCAFFVRYKLKEAHGQRCHACVTPSIFTLTWLVDAAHTPNATASTPGPCLPGARTLTSRVLDDNTQA